MVRKRLCGMLACVASLSWPAVAAGPAADAKGAAAPTGTRVMGSVGWARGHVLDAATGRYLDGASVELVLSPDCLPVPNSRGKTGKEGRYQFDAPLGTRKDAYVFNLAGSLFDNIFGGNKITRHLEASQLVLRISKPGYLPYCGPAAVENGTASPFIAWLGPVYLAPTAAGYRSYAADANTAAHLLSVAFDPVDPKPGAAVKVRVTAEGLALGPGEWPMLLCSPREGRPGALKRVASGEPYVFEGYIRAGFIGVQTVYVAPRFESGLVNDGLVTRRYLAVGATDDKRDEVKTALAELNGLVAQSLAYTRAGADLEQRIESLLPVDAREGKIRAAWERYAEAIKSRDCPAWLAAEKHVRLSADESPLRQALVGAALTRRNPANVAAREQYARAVYNFSQNVYPGNPDVHDAVMDPAVLAALSDPQFPPLPPATTPAARLMAAKFAVMDGRRDEAVNELKQLAKEPSVALSAKTVLANLVVKTEPALAKSLYGELLVKANWRVVKSFSAYANGIELLLADGADDSVQPLLDVAISYGRSRQFALDAPGVSGYMPGIGFYSMHWSARRAGSVGFAYPEGRCLELLRANWPYLAHPEGDWMAACSVAQALSGLGVHQRALALAEKALSAKPEDEYALATLAAARAAAGDSAGAAEATAKLLAINSRNPDGLRLKAQP